MQPAPASPILDAARRPALLHYVRDRRCVLFVGAGLSLAAGYPDWSGLMRSVMKASTRTTSLPSARRELNALLKAGRFAELADQCREILGRTRFAEILRAELAKPVAPPEATHRAIVQTPYAAIVTTNFDTLLEDAFALWSSEGIPKAPTGAQLGRHGTLLLDGAFFILKAHGTIHDDASLVFTSEDYRRIMHANPAFQSMMAAILLTHAVVFVGYSLKDPNFRLLIEDQLSVFGTQSPPRYAVMAGVDALEAEILRRTAGIEVISYPAGQHHNVTAFLQTLASATENRAPRSSVVIRTRSSQPALRLIIRPREAMLDVQWFETTTDDLDGVGVPLTRRWMAPAPSLPWIPLLRNTDPDKLAAYSRLQEYGTLIAEPFRHLQIPLSASRLVLLDVPSELAPIPWEWMVVNGAPLCLQAPVCRAVPGFNDASRGRPFFHQPLRVLVIGDATRDAHLGHTHAEATAVASLFEHHDTTILLGSDSCYMRVLREIGAGYDIVHVAGAAFVDNGETVVPLHDGNVRASELATLLIRKPPGLVFLNAAYSGFVPGFCGLSPIVSGSPESFADFYHRMQRYRPGLERVVARAGVGTFIGCMAPTADATPRAMAVSFYKHLLEGENVANALFHARRSIPITGDGSPLLFAMAGYPDTAIVARPPVTDT